MQENKKSQQAREEVNLLA